MAEHLINQVTLGQHEHWLVLPLADSAVHNLDDLVLVLDKELHLLDLVDLLGNCLGKLVQSLDQQLFVQG